MCPHNNQKIMLSINLSSSTRFLLGRIFVILVYFASVFSTPPSCGLYGSPPCQFLPAPPGQTPSCARPGRTYCEHVDNYPTYLIKHLVHKWGYEAKSIIVDETWEEFDALNLPIADIHNFYDPALIFNTQTQTQHPYGSNNFNGYKYDGPNRSKTSPANNNAFSTSPSLTVGPAANNGYPEPIYIPKPHNADTAKFLIYTSSGQQQATNRNKYTNILPSDQNNAKTTNYSPAAWFKRYVRDLSTRAKKAVQELTSSARNMTSPVSTRDVSMNLNLYDIVGVNRENHRHRVKRQSEGRSTLCQTSSQFIMPQAALNSKGNWMFVVNEQNTARQLVKAELCVSTVCANLCQLPNGYTSRCEQKFVQKRLIALQGNGENLYTDSFWFPSCCVCTIASSLM
ncbi:protein spaetzle 5 [Eupeodes corollae]|uniref:protein spaetzle 5 n=1 Tax=Eupeodes corollae TaxID=290404 RepID=UPI00248F7E2C|nr:protein spaetzle 5 [Eupeodes corollae]XP_055911538.1 protein spaetzle 5 [Eupeodes corollae]XP_055911539.1 protein spaetzle 5 [Eupeodes corollae]XP_055911540.1 protein spaetzle 5 [Eupeodes corollae]XP_055911541.1 protein spaetzle 5 [Eupeodes corollae]